MKLAINHKNCCTEKDGIPWCKECVPCYIIEGWSSGNHDIDEFIKNTIYNANLRHTNPKPIKVALKRLNGSQNISAEYLNELKTHWDLNQSFDDSLKFYGMTKDPETKEFMMILEFAEKGNLRCFLSNFGLSRPSNEQVSNKVCGVLPYIAPEVLNGEPYTLSSDIYSFWSLAICNGLRPEFGKGTPEFYKKLAHKCMNANSHQRPTAIELYEIIDFWDKCIKSINYQEKKNWL
ncbi:unnamed protein product [Rhizophagus irregularis]|nr:unnamed protein product [Rhizophagus irregularis]